MKSTLIIYYKIEMTIEVTIMLNYLTNSRKGRLL
jgi:hypothetical protein